MKAQAQAEPMAMAAPHAGPADYLALVKPRLSWLVLVTAFAGYYMASSGTFDYARALHTLVGTALVAGGANALNQVIERRRDALMKRTRDRPLAAKRMSPAEGALFSLAASLLGVGYLYLTTTPAAAAVALITLLVYVCIYTPLKTVTWLNTFVGAIPGALPPLIGWTAVTGALRQEAWILFAILFLWQIPHFMAIAILYREDYARGGFKMLPVEDPTGDRTAWQIVGQGIALLAVSLLPTLAGLTGYVYLAGALVLGVLFAVFGIAAAVGRTDRHARRLLFASIVYLPALLTIMMIDKT